MVGRHGLRKQIHRPPANANTPLFNLRRPRIANDVDPLAATCCSFARRTGSRIRGAASGRVSGDAFAVLAFLGGAEGMDAAFEG
jgi:hypothetical protein